MKNVVNATEPIQCGNKGSTVANVPQVGDSAAYHKCKYQST